MGTLIDAGESAVAVINSMNKNIQNLASEINKSRLSSDDAQAFGRALGDLGKTLNKFNADFGKFKGLKI